MNFWKKREGEAAGRRLEANTGVGESGDLELEQALENFRMTSSYNNG